MSPYVLGIREITLIETVWSILVISLKNFVDYSKLFGWALALGHARSGDAAELSGYCGESKQFGEAMYSFARSYAKQNQQDFGLFCKAVKSGRLKAAKKKTAL